SAAPAHGRRRLCCSRAWSSRPLLPPQCTTASAPLPLHLRRRHRVRPSRALFPSQVDPGGARAAELVHGAVVVGRSVSADTVGSLRLSCRRPSTREVYSQVSCMDKAFPKRLLQEGAAAVLPRPDRHGRLGRRSKGDGRWGDGPASDAAGDAAGARPGPAHGGERAGQQQSHLASVIAKNQGKYGSSIKALRPKPAVAAG
uniref:Uncharacterized protein n=1 Tax=Triticum urartu TaxID=4572 RepID=A0A8R7U085_TRIUA